MNNGQAPRKGAIITQTHFDGHSLHDQHFRTPRGGWEIGYYEMQSLLATNGGGFWPYCFTFHIGKIFILHEILLIH